MSYYIPIKQFFCPVTPLNAGEIILMISSWSNHSNKPMSSTISHIDWTTIGCFQSFKLTRDAASLFFNVCAYLTLPIRIHELENASVRPSSFHEIAEGLGQLLFLCNSLGHKSKKILKRSFKKPDFSDFLSVIEIPELKCVIFKQTLIRKDRSRSFANYLHVCLN